LVAFLIGVCLDVLRDQEVVGVFVRFSASPTSGMSKGLLLSATAASMVMSCGTGKVSSSYA
jgi:hypothetical protein